MVLKFYKYPNKYLSLIKISIMVGLVLFLPLNTRSLFAEKKSNCSLAPSIGAKFMVTGPDSWEFLMTVQKYKNNDNFLTEKIGLLKLKAAEGAMEFLGGLSTELEIKKVENVKGELIKESFTYEQNFDWNDMKPILISMKKSFHCFDDDEIVFSGKWTSDSVQNAYRHINLEKAYDELISITDVVGERSILDDKKFKKKFPKLWETDDPEYVKNAIKYVIRMRGL